MRCHWQGGGVGERNLLHSGMGIKKSRGLQVIELFNVRVIELIDALDLLR